MRNFNAKDVTQVLTGLTHLGSASPALLQAIVQHCHTILPTFDTQVRPECPAWDLLILVCLSWCF